MGYNNFQTKIILKDQPLIKACVNRNVLALCLSNRSKVSPKEMAFHKQGATAEKNLSLVAIHFTSEGKAWLVEQLVSWIGKT